MEIILERAGIAVLISGLLAAIVRFIPPVWLAFQRGPFFYSRVSVSPDRIEKMFALSNPGLQWKTVEVKVGQDVEIVPYPNWDCYVLFDDPAFFGEFHAQLMEHFESLFVEAKICAVSTAGLFFLGKIEGSLRAVQATVFPRDEHFPIPDEWRGAKLVLFDLNLNTGKTMIQADRFFRAMSWQPSAFVVVFHNDLVPQAERVFPTPDSGSCFHYLYLASHVIRYWKDRGAINVFQTVERAFAGALSWQDQTVREALTKLNIYTSSEKGQKPN